MSVLLCVPNKMADGVCAEGTANSVKDSVMKQTVDLLSISHKDCLNENSLNALKSSFYINADSGELCSNFRINGVVGLGVHASAMLCGASNDHVEFSSLCPNNGDNCRKKRCADRYDSSESSDSGVATLSCTDCSTSSSSSGTSDITDPGSPYSTTSTHSSASETSDDSSTAPGTPRKRTASLVTSAEPVQSQWASTTDTPDISDSHSEESKDQHLWLQSAEVTTASTEEVDSKPRTRNRSLEVPPLSPENVNSSPKPTHVSRTCHWSLNKTSNPSINMAPNVPSRQEQDSVEPCWPWGGKERSAIIERDKGPPPPPPPLAVTATPLTPVTANVIANPSVKLLKRQTAITSLKTAANTVSSASVQHAKRLKVEHHSSKIGVKAGPLNNNSNITKNNNNNNCVKVTSPCATSQRQQLPRCCTNHQKSQCISSQSHLKLKCCSADNNATTRSKCSSHDSSREASPLSKVSQQGKITEYFKTQVKPLNGVKKELASLVVKSNSEFRSPGSQHIKKSVNVEPKFCEADTPSLDKYFSNLLSGTKVASKTAPRGAVLSKSNESKRDIKSWTMGIADGKLSKVPVKVTEKKTGGVSAAMSTSAHMRKLLSSSASAKFLDSKSNSMNAASPKPANNTQSPIPRSCSPTLDVKVAENNSVCSVPKVAASASETMTKPKTLTAEVSPPSPATPTQSSSPPQSTVCAAEKSSLSIDSSDVPSPILAAPTNIRFPAMVHSASDSGSSSAVLLTVSSQGFQPKVIGAQSDVTADSNVCRWSECDTHFDTSTGLLEHLQAKHVNPQVTCENYVCLWVGCKVYARTSCSRSWLERHVLSHGGNKPFRCIVDGCGQRFSSQTTLERHVNSHFNQTEGGNGNSGARRSLDNATSKLFRRNGKKLRYRRQPWSARMFDYFDAGIMEGLQHRLVSMTEIQTQGNVATASGNTITLHSKVLARRVVADGRREILLHWFPEDILADEWVAESDVQRKRNVPIPSLPSSALLNVQSLLFGRDVLSSQPGNNSSQHSRKHRRKPLKVT